MAQMPMAQMPLAADRPWLAHYPEGVPPQIDLEKLPTLTSLLSQSCRQNADKTAFISFGVLLTFRDFERHARAFAAWFQAQGFQKGDRIGLMMPNVMGYPVAMYGALLGGFTVVNINPLYTARELIHQLTDSGAKAIVVLENFASVVAEALPHCNVKKVVLVSAGDLLGFKGHIISFVAKHIKKVVPAYSLPQAIRLPALLAIGAGAGLRPVEISLDDIAFLQYTGGTTGVSKGATLSHRNVAANVMQNDAWLSGTVGKIPDNVMVTALPLYHIFALTCCCLLMLKMGAACLLIANPRDIKGFIGILKSSRFTLMSGVNTLYNALANHPDIGSVNFSSLKFCVAGGMATQQAVAKQWKALTGCAIAEGYGLSETSPVLTINRPDLGEFSGTIGYPLPGTEIVLRNSNNESVPMGESGEICARGPQVMVGYWQRPDETAKVMTPDGFFRTGDIGIMLPDGQFKIVDRLKDMILVSGFNVYPNEVEDVIAQHPGVLEVAVIGVPDSQSSEAVAAYVVRKDPNLTLDALKAHCREGLTGYKVPKQIHFRDSLPKSNVGKVLRRMLRDEVSA